MKHLGIITTYAALALAVPTDFPEQNTSAGICAEREFVPEACDYLTKQCKRFGVDELHCLEVIFRQCATESDCGAGFFCEQQGTNIKQCHLQTQSHGPEQQTEAKICEERKLDKQGCDNGIAQCKSYKGDQLNCLRAIDKDCALVKGCGDAGLYCRMNGFTPLGNCKVRQEK